MAEVSLHGITKRFAKTTAVSNLDLDVKDGEFLVLVGPSGCGKTTTLRMIAGLEDPDEGEILIGGRPMTGVQPKDRDIAMVFQNYALYPHMDVYNNMAFGLKMKKIPKDEIDERVKEAAKILGIEELLERKPKALSGGQRQRVALGRAIVRKPKAFLMDEPLSNLDAKLRVQMRAELSRIHKRIATTIVYVTHDQTEAMTMGERIVLLKDGLVQQQGEPMDLYENPINAFVAGFIGSPSMNLFEAELSSDDNHPAVVLWAGMKVPVDKSRFARLEKAKDGKVLFGIRPEDIEDSEFCLKRDEDLSFPAIADVVEPMGSETMLYLSAYDKQIVAKVNPSTKAAFGKTVSLQMDRTKYHLFDRATGLSLR